MPIQTKMTNKVTSVHSEELCLLTLPGLKKLAANDKSNNEYNDEFHVELENGDNHENHDDDDDGGEDAVENHNKDNAYGDSDNVMSVLTSKDFIPKPSMPGDVDVNIETEEEESLVPDGGWGWVVCFASFIINFILDGTMFSFGILLLWLLADLGQDKATTSWVGSALLGVSMIMGPVVSVLLQRFTIRQVTICGSLLSAAGFVGSVFAPNVYVLILTFGIIGGIGFGMTFLPSIIVVGLYFNTKRAIATGIATSGSGLGTFAYAYISEGLLNEFNWRGTVLLLAGLVLNCAVCGMLFRPLVKSPKKKSCKTKSRKHEEKFDYNMKPNMADSHSASSGYSSDHIGQDKPSIDDVASAADNEEIRQNELKAIPEMAASKRIRARVNSGVDEPRDTFRSKNSLNFAIVSHNSSKDYQTNDVNSVNVEEVPSILISNTSIVESSRPQCTRPNESSTLSLLKDAIRNRQMAVNGTDDPMHTKGSMLQIRAIENGDLTPVQYCKSELNAPDKQAIESMLLSSKHDGYGFKLRALGRMYNSVDFLHHMVGSGPLGSHDNTRIRLLHSEYKLNDFGPAMTRNFDHKDVQHTYTDMGSKRQISKGLMKPILRKDIFYSGSVSHLPAFRQFGSVNTFMAAMTRRSSCTDDEDTMAPRNDWQRKKTISAAIKKALPMELFANRTFVLLLITFSMWTAQSVSLTYLPDLAVSMGIDRGKAAFLISIVGIANVLGRILAGVVTDVFRVPSIWLYFGALTTAAAVNFVLAFATTYAILAACCGIFGLCMAVAVSMRTIVLAEQLGIEALTRSFGVVALFQGIAFTISPPIAGKLIDEFHSFKPPFLMASMMYLLASITTLVVGVLGRSEYNRRKRMARSMSLQVVTRTTSRLS